MSLLHRLREWLEPTPPDRPLNANAAEATRVAGIQAETARRLQGDLHARKADRQLRETREELIRQRARVAVLDVRAAVRGREEGA